MRNVPKWKFKIENWKRQQVEIYLWLKSVQKFIKTDKNSSKILYESKAVNLIWKKKSHRCKSKSFDQISIVASEVAFQIRVISIKTFHTMLSPFYIEAKLFLVQPLFRQKLSTFQPQIFLKCRLINFTYAVVNHVYNILIIFDSWENFPFTASETNRDYW